MLCSCFWQVESSINMQALQPRMKALQEKYKNDPERLQKETAALYQEAGVNPLSGCLPTLATIPVFIGLYRALLLAADEGLLKDGFFWIPSLAGPTTISARQAVSTSVCSDSFNALIAMICPWAGTFYTITCAPNPLLKFDAQN